MDFPTAWAIVNATSPADHDPRCSFAQTGGALLCDCHVLTSHPQYIADYGACAASQEVVTMPSDDYNSRRITRWLERKVKESMRRSAQEMAAKLRAEQK